jgi:hypothetical protein
MGAMAMHFLLHNRKEAKGFERFVTIRRQLNGFHN